MPRTSQCRLRADVLWTRRLSQKIRPVLCPTESISSRRHYYFMEWAAPVRRRFVSNFGGALWQVSLVLCGLKFQVGCLWYAQVHGKSSGLIVPVPKPWAELTGYFRTNRWSPRSGSHNDLAANARDGMPSRWFKYQLRLYVSDTRSVIIWILKLSSWFRHWYYQSRRFSRNLSIFMVSIQLELQTTKEPSHLSECPSTNWDKSASYRRRPFHEVIVSSGRDWSVGQSTGSIFWDNLPSSEHLARKRHWLVRGISTTSITIRNGSTGAKNKS